MNSSVPHSSHSFDRSELDGYPNPSQSTVSWGAIFAGATVGLALQVLFMMLGAGLGFAIFSPITEENPVVNLSIGALIIQTIGAILSLCAGGWVAGRFTPVCARATGWLHGFSVWCAATVGGVVMVAFGAVWMLGGISSLVGGGLSAAGEPVSAITGGAMDLATEAVKESEETITSFIDEALSNRQEGGVESEGIRAKREIGFALARLFNPLQESNTAANRKKAITVLVDHADMSQAEAEQTITEWTNTYEQLQADLAALKEAAATKAREAAKEAADVLATFSLFTFVGFLLGALAATFGGYLGAKNATDCEEADEDRDLRYTTDGFSRRQSPDAEN